tara:strand:+ start:97 stop:450 length:354 start_codon:yes stop_codon:yes gene_type:complete
MKITEQQFKQLIAEELQKELKGTLNEQADLNALIGATVQEWENLQVATDKLAAQIKKLPNISVKYKCEECPGGVAEADPGLVAMYVRSAVYQVHTKTGERLNRLFDALVKQQGKKQP